MSARSGDIVFLQDVSAVFLGYLCVAALVALAVHALLRNENGDAASIKAVSVTVGIFWAIPVIVLTFCFVSGRLQESSPRLSTVFQEIGRLIAEKSSGMFDACYERFDNLFSFID